MIANNTGVDWLTYIQYFSSIEGHDLHRKVKCSYCAKRIAECCMFDIDLVTVAKQSCNSKYRISISCEHERKHTEIKKGVCQGWGKFTNTTTQFFTDSYCPYMTQISGHRYDCDRRVLAEPQTHRVKTCWHHSSRKTAQIEWRSAKAERGCVSGRWWHGHWEVPRVDASDTQQEEVLNREEGDLYKKRTNKHTTAKFCHS